MIGRYLDPETAYAEILFGLIMALTFTLGATLVVGTGGEALHEIVYGAVTCNVAWGVIDAFFYILAELFELGQRGKQIRQVQTALTKSEAVRRIREVFDERIGPAATPEQRAQFYEAVHPLVMRMQAPRRRPTRDGLIGAAIVCILVSITSLPIVLPTLVIADTHAAIRVGNILLLACLFATGYGMAREVGGHPIRFGSIMAAVGLVLVVVAQALGG